MIWADKEHIIQFNVGKKIMQVLYLSTYFHIHIYTQNRTSLEPACGLNMLAKITWTSCLIPWQTETLQWFKNY